MKHTLSLTGILCALASCGGDGAPPGGVNAYNLSGASPYPTQLAMGQSVRNLVLRMEARTGAQMQDSRCGYSFVLFDVTRASTQTPLATGVSGDCKLYMTPPEDDYAAQNWVCAGGISTDSGALMQTTGFCPQPGAPPPWEGEFRTCGGFLQNLTATVASVPSEFVSDLNGTVRFPSQPIVSEPSVLPVSTWPAAGDVTVAWTSSNATSAVVRVSPDAPSRRGPTIICTPRVNGSIRVDASLIDRSGLRGMNARVHVWSYRETPTRAENRTWQLVGAMGTSVLMQPGR